MIALAVWVVASQVESPRLRTLLPNGAATIVETVKDAPYATIHLFASTRDCRETPENNGWRHLFEHLILSGFDAEAQSKGMFLTGSTFREFSRFEIKFEPSKLSDATKSIASLLRRRTFDEATITKEIGIVDQEMALLTDAQRLTQGAWQHSYEGQRPDPFGTLESLAKCTPQELDAVRERLFNPPNVVVAIVGPMDVKSMSQAASSIVGGLTARSFGTQTNEPAAAQVRGRFEVVGVVGEARSTICAGLRSKEGMATLCAALALGSDFEDSFFSYTPSLGSSLMTIGRTRDVGPFTQGIDGLNVSEFQSLWERGKTLARSWFATQMKSPRGLAYLRGLYLLQNRSAKPEDSLALVESVSESDFVAAASRFAKSGSVVTVGVR